MAERLRALALALLWLVAGFAHALDCAPLALASPAPAPVTEFARGLLWRITAADGAGGYVLGTMHVGDPRVQDVIARSAAAFGASRRFVLEVDLDLEATTHLQQAMFYQDGRRLALDEFAGGGLGRFHARWLHVVGAHAARSIESEDDRAFDPGQADDGLGPRQGEGQDGQAEQEQGRWRDTLPGCIPRAAILRQPQAAVARRQPLPSL